MFIVKSVCKKARIFQAFPPRVRSSVFWFSDRHKTPPDELKFDFSQTLLAFVLMNESIFEEDESDDEYQPENPETFINVSEGGGEISCGEIVDIPSSNLT